MVVVDLPGRRRLDHPPFTTAAAYRGARLTTAAPSGAAEARRSVDGSRGRRRGVAVPRAPPQSQMLGAGDGGHAEESASSSKNGSYGVFERLQPRCGLHPIARPDVPVGEPLHEPLSIRPPTRSCHRGASTPSRRMFDAGADLETRHDGQGGRESRADYRRPPASKSGECCNRRSVCDDVTASSGSRQSDDATQPNVRTTPIVPPRPVPAPAKSTSPAPGHERRYPTLGTLPTRPWPERVPNGPTGALERT